MFEFKLIVYPFACLRLYNAATDITSRKFYIFGIRVGYWTCSPGK